MALLIIGVSGIDGRIESIVWGLHGMALIWLVTFPTMAATTIA